MQFREVLPSDHDAWLAMRSALWPHCQPGRHASEMKTYGGGNESCVTFVAAQEPGAELCGFVEASLRETAEGCVSRPVGYIEGIFVWPEFRRRGLGRQLVETASQWAADHDCVELASDCHLDNEDSIGFHRGMGFEVAKRLVHFRRRISGAAEEE